MLGKYTMTKSVSQKQSPPTRINIYVAPDDMVLFQPVAEKLHKQGVPGMLDSSGRVIRSAVIAHLLREKAAE